jgi:DNA-binding transcriptional LysR family regulator
MPKIHINKVINMNIESKSLEDFLALAECRSFSKAAEFRNMTQPAFSRRIKALEETVGVQLIDRSKMPIDLTLSGSVFRTSARNLLSQINDTVDQLIGLSRLDGNVVKIAAAHSLATNLVHNLNQIPDNRTDGPMLNVEAIDVDRAIEALQQGDCDILLAFNNELLSLPPYLSMKIGDAKLLPVSGCDPDGVPLHQFSDERSTPFLAYSLNSYMGRQVEKVRAKVSLDVIFTSSMTDLLKMRALSGKGVAWLPDYSISKELEQKRLAVIGTEDLTLPISFYAYRYQARLHRSGEQCWNDLREMAARQQ